jgi:hypothetical protein
MPDISLFNSNIITVEDIYKFNIEKSGPFTCFNCDKPLQFRQSRNADNNYTEHFYHPNTTKDTHIDCENNTLERIRDNDTWHNTFSNFINQESREVIRRNAEVKHIVDAYDSFNDMGIEFQNSPISVEAVQSRDATTYLDWVFNVENHFIRKVKIGNKMVCEIPHDNWERAVKAVKNKVYLYTGANLWILLEDRENYRIEIDGIRRNVWIGKPCPFQKVYDETCLQNMLLDEGKTYFESLTKEISKVQIIYARCKKSMFLLDGIHRRYVNKHEFSVNEILAIKSVAGSGKTTTLLNLAQIHKDKKILYLAFNKALITDIGAKIKKQGIKNLYPQTFHALIYGAYMSVKKMDPRITELKPQTIHNFVGWFKGKPFAIRKHYVNMYMKFCANPMINKPEEYAMKTEFKERPLLNSLWAKTLTNELLTFESLLKLSLINNWLKGYIDKHYDIIMIDETQDFDLMMLTMLLNDTTIPKIFVGDPKQSIYEWRGCIDGFKYLPKNALTIEFYSTFRVGDPACERIREKFNDCWMISKSVNQTVITPDTEALKEKPYTYLFRSWKRLLRTAQDMKEIWISNYEEQKRKMRSLHTILCEYGGNFSEDEFEDDLPKFLKSLTEDDLNNIISNIDSNLVSKDAAKYKFYTIHAYKGLEDEHVRIADDIEDKLGDDKNLYYVALTRGMKTIVEDLPALPIMPFIEKKIVIPKTGSLIWWN